MPVVFLLFLLESSFCHNILSVVRRLLTRSPAISWMKRYPVNSRQLYACPVVFYFAFSQVRTGVAFPHALPLSFICPVQFTPIHPPMLQTGMTFSNAFYCPGLFDCPSILFLKLLLQRFVMSQYIGPLCCSEGIGIPGCFFI